MSFRENVQENPLKQVAPLDCLPFDVWTFPSGSTEDRLEAPNRYKDVGCYDYYCMDLASLIPVIMLGVKPGHTVLDTCAAPGQYHFKCFSF